MDEFMEYAFNHNGFLWEKSGGKPLSTTESLKYMNFKVAIGLDSTGNLRKLGPKNCYIAVDVSVTPGMKYYGKHNFILGYNFKKQIFFKCRDFDRLGTLEKLKEGKDRYNNLEIFSLDATRLSTLTEDDIVPIFGSYSGVSEFNRKYNTLHPLFKELFKRLIFDVVDGN